MHFILNFLLVLSLFLSIFANDEGIQQSTSTDKQQVEPTEYRKFLEFLKQIQIGRNQTFTELEQNYGNSLIDMVKDGQHKRWMFNYTERKYNFTTGIHYEDEFHCDLEQLTACESELLNKIQLIQGSVEESVSQLEVLQVCKSMDKEFSCLVDFAEKCENRMTLSTFSLLRFIIQNNNHTLIACQHKEQDWVGFDSESLTQSKAPEEWQDAKGIWHVGNPSQTAPCLESSRVQYCVQESFGLEFDLGRDAISTLKQCENIFHFEHCLMRELFDSKPHVSNHCKVDIRSLTLNFLLSTVRWNLTAIENDQTSESKIHSSLCKSVSISWKSQVQYEDANESCERITEEYGHHYTSLLKTDCQRKTNGDMTLCYKRFNERLRKLWISEDHPPGLQTDEERADAMCCVTAELSTCLETFVLVRCGLEQFSSFKYQLEAKRLNTLQDSCIKLQYSTLECQLNILSKL